MNNETVIEVKKVTHMYDNGVEALKNVDLTLCKGEFVGLIGQNGSGKSTLVKHLNGLLKPTKGEVLILGTSTLRKSLTDIAKTVGFVFQNPDHQIFCSSVEEEIAFGPRNMGLSEDEINGRVKDALKRFHIEKFAKYPPAILGFGIRRKVSLAGIYSMKPQVLILDEPTTGLDWRSTLELMDIVVELNELGHTIVFITHDMRIVAEFTERSIVLCGGEVIADGKTREVLSDFKMLEKTQILPPQITRLSSAVLQGKKSSYAMSNQEFLEDYDSCWKGIAT